MKNTTMGPSAGNGRASLLDSDDHINIDSAGNSASEFTHLLAKGPLRSGTSTADKSPRANFYGKGKDASAGLGLEKEDALAGSHWTWMCILPAIVLPTIGTGMSCADKSVTSGLSMLATVCSLARVLVVS